MRKVRCILNCGVIVMYACVQCVMHCKLRCDRVELINAMFDTLEGAV